MRAGRMQDDGMRADGMRAGRMRAGRMRGRWDAGQMGTTGR